MEETVQPEKKRRGWPKGKPRGPRPAPVSAPMFTPAPEPEAPIRVRVLLKNGFESEFGAGDHFVENGFHVFTYGSVEDPYRTTRREFAVSEIVEIEVTGPRVSQHRIEPETVWSNFGPAPIGPRIEPTAPNTASGPKIHNARASALAALETSKGPIRMETMPNLTFGNHEG